MATIKRRRVATVGCLAAMAALLTTTACTPTPPVVGLRTTIRTTSHGVPHVLAADYRGVGFGAGYAFARDALCEVAGRFITVRGERSRHFGPDALVPDGPSNHPTNAQSDFFWKWIEAKGLVDAELALPPPLGPTPEVRDLVRGYVEGYNRFLTETGRDRLPDPRCRGAGWVAPITEKDVYLRAMHWNLMRSSGNLIPELVAAAPPGTGQRADPATGDATFLFGMIGEPGTPPPTGSNMIALGADATDNGQGMFFANPHWYWEGPERWYEIQLTIPGRLNVMGVQTSGLPVIQTGFTEGVAWAGTSSYAKRYTPYRLRLSPASPTRYLHDGQEREMVSRRVTITVRAPDGGLEERQHLFWETHFGPLLGGGNFPWDGNQAYAIRDVAYSFRWLNQQLATNQARSTEDISEAGKRYMAIGWRNIGAADADGNVFYGDRTAIPHVTNAQAAACTAPGESAALFDRFRLVTLDGSRSDCDWGSDADAPVPGIFAARQLPQLHRRDYMNQSNDTHWANNPRQLLEGYPGIMGLERTPRTLRTRNGLSKIERRLSGTDGLPGRGFTLDLLERIALDNRVYSGELWRDAVVTLCRRQPAATRVSAACPVLAAWDLTENLDSPGAILWRRFVERLGRPDDLYTVPFDPADPIGTPRGLDIANPRVATALTLAVGDLLDGGMKLTATLRDHQYAIRGSEHLPVHGGTEEVGQYNIVYTRDGWVPGQGYPDVEGGASYMMFVQFTPAGPVGRSILTYSQSPDPTSAWHTDQTRMFTEKRTKSILFREPDILADPALSVTEICATPDGKTISCPEGSKR